MLRPNLVRWWLDPRGPATAAIYVDAVGIEERDVAARVYLLELIDAYMAIREMGVDFQLPTHCLDETSQSRNVRIGFLLDLSDGRHVSHAALWSAVLETVAGPGVALPTVTRPS
jgi:hypothetical protein